MAVKTPAEYMRESAEVQESRDAEYGSAYKRHGPAIAGLFPDGVVLVTESDHTRFGVLTLMFGKLVRYCGSFERGGHEDSLTDLIAYAAMLKEVDAEYAEAAEVVTNLSSRVSDVQSTVTQGHYAYDPRLEK